MRGVGVGEAADILRRGGIVAFPTETVYGLGADAARPDAVAKIFAAKGRPSRHPVIVHLFSSDDAGEWADDVPPAARRLADLLWPGPLTLVLPRGEAATDAVTGGLPTIGLRVPAHPIARELLALFGGAIAAPSANRFGSVSPTTADHVRADLEGRIDAIVDGGACPIGIESTIVDASGDTLSIVRPGAVTRETIEEILGEPIPLAADPKGAPGTLASHYAPRARVVAIAASELATRGRDYASAHSGDRIAAVVPRSTRLPFEGVDRIDAPDDPAGRARTLYAALRDLDARGYTRAIVVLPEDERGLGLAIADRIRRAAGPR
jgi:L-threonylcarbamoyladenylate synthase